MKMERLRDCLCEWLGTLGVQAIHAYSNTPAPDGMYVAVYTQGMNLHGVVMRPGANDSGRKRRCAQWVVTIQLFEVEGDGDALRTIREGLEQGCFEDFARGKFPDTDGLDYSVGVWNIGEIADNSAQDGNYWIPQRTMIFDLQFNEWMEEPTRRVAGTELIVGGENMNVEIKE